MNGGDTPASRSQHFRHHSRLITWIRHQTQLHTSHNALSPLPRNQWFQLENYNRRKISSFTVRLFRGKNRNISQWKAPVLALSPRLGAGWAESTIEKMGLPQLTVQGNYKDANDEQKGAAMEADYQWSSSQEGQNPCFWSAQVNSVPFSSAPFPNPKRCPFFMPYFLWRRI